VRSNFYHYTVQHSFQVVFHKIIYLAKGLSRDVFMNKKLEYASIIDKNDSSFDRHLAKIFKRLNAQLFMGHPLEEKKNSSKQHFTFSNDCSVETFSHIMM
jgi:hypothetical protein